MRAAAQNPVSSRLCGIRVGWMLGARLGAGRAGRRGGGHDGRAGGLPRPEHDGRHPASTPSPRRRWAASRARSARWSAASWSGVIENLVGTYVPLHRHRAQADGGAGHDHHRAPGQARAASSAAPSSAGSSDGAAARRGRRGASARGRSPLAAARRRPASLALPSLSGFRLFQFTQVCIYAIALLGLNMLTGYNGQISLGHGAFYAIGAYTTAIMIDRWDIGYGWTIPVAGVVCLVVGLPLRPARPAPGGALPRAGDLLARPGRAADPQVLRALDGRLPGHRADQAQGALRAAADRGPVALLPRPRGPPRALRRWPGTSCAGAPGAPSWPSATTTSPPRRWASTTRSTSRSSSG